MRTEEQTESFPALVVGVAKEEASRLLGQKSQEKLQLLLGAKRRGSSPALWLKDHSLARDHSAEAAMEGCTAGPKETCPEGWEKYQDSPNSFQNKHVLT